MQKINLRDLYPDVYKTDVFVDVAEEVLAAIRDQQQDDAAYERRKFRRKAASVRVRRNKVVPRKFQALVLVRLSPAG